MRLILHNNIVKRYSTDTDQPLSINPPVERIRKVFKDNFGIIFIILKKKHMLWVLIRIASPR